MAAIHFSQNATPENAYITGFSAILSFTMITNVRKMLNNVKLAGLKCKILFLLDISDNTSTLLIQVLNLIFKTNFCTKTIPLHQRCAFMGLY